MFDSRLSALQDGDAIECTVNDTDTSDKVTSVESESKELAADETSVQTLGNALGHHRETELSEGVLREEQSSGAT